MSHAIEYFLGLFGPAQLISPPYLPLASFLEDQKDTSLKGNRYFQKKQVTFR